MKTYNLTEDQKKRLIDIVGEENLGLSEWERDAYGVWFGSSFDDEGNINWTNRAAAIVTPETAEQVHEITQYCNETDLMVHPTSTGQIVAGAATDEKTLILDLARMNNIIEMDGDNMTAVVEPFVRSVDLQLQAWKKNCNPFVISIGAVGSTLAAATSHVGYGGTGTSTGQGARTLLGVEWVMPNGKKIRIGSAGQGSGWFTAAGPGPDLIGTIRGFNGAMGGLGTYTKAAIKMGPWYGPKELGTDELNFECKMPSYKLNGDLPSNMSINTTVFPSMKSLSDAHYRMHEESIVYSGARLPAFIIAMATSKTNAETMEKWNSGLHQKINQYTVTNQIIGASQEEYEWKQAAFNKIIEEAGGLRLPRALGLYPEIAKDIVKLFHAGLPEEEYKELQLDIQARIDAEPQDDPVSRAALSGSAAGALRNVDSGLARPASAMFTLGGNFDTWDAGIALGKNTEDIKKPLVDRGGILDDGIDTACGNAYESGHMGYTENIFWINRWSGTGGKAWADMHEESVELVKKGFSSFTFSHGIKNEQYGPYENDYHIWTKRMKKLLDPNDAADSFTYSGTPDHKDIPMNG